MKFLGLLWDLLWCESYVVITFDKNLIMEVSYPRSELDRARAMLLIASKRSMELKED